MAFNEEGHKRNAEMSDPVTKTAVCAMCHARCRVLVTSENDHLVNIEEDASFPKAGKTWPRVRGCLRLRGAKEWMYHPERVNYPRKRMGERGAGRWQTISWEQAFDEIAAKLTELKDKYGPETLAFTGGTGRTMSEYVSRFANLFGTPNHTGPGQVCHGPIAVLAQTMCGWALRHRTGLTIEQGDGKKPLTKCIMLAGINPAPSVLRLWNSLRQCRAAGVKVIVIDPRRTETAELADLWLQLRPGTDYALFLGLINVIIKEGLYDNEFVTQWTHGFDRVTARVSPYTPEAVAEITWVPAEKILAAARMYATNTPALFPNGMGTEHLQDASSALQARLILSAICGNIDVRGGEVMSGPNRHWITAPEFSLEHMLSAEQKDKMIGSDDYRLFSYAGREMIQAGIEKMWGVRCGTASHCAMAHAPSVYRAILSSKPYPVRALYTVASNPMVTMANTMLVQQALKALDLYVVNDFFMTPSAELADYVLPAATWLERPRVYDNSGEDSNLYAGEAALPASIEGEYDHKTDYEIFRGLAHRLGLGEYFPWPTMEDSFDYRLQAMGISFKEFMERGGYIFPPDSFKKYEKMGGFATPTGKLELYSTIIAKLGYEPLPPYQESFENPLSRPDLAKEYPLMLITGGRFRWTFHSEYFQVPSIRRLHPDPLIQIHPDTAAPLEIKDGDWVWIEGPRGKVRMKCRFFDGLDPRVVHAEHGWWFPEKPGAALSLHGVLESNINVLTDDEHCDPVHGGWPLKTGLCRVYKE